MDESKRRMIRFLEKEIKTYVALDLFLSKRGIKDHPPIGDGEVLVGPTFYRERLKEARRLVAEASR
jgi:hypothetical protein